jgi:hypothetical protein
MDNKHQNQRINKNFLINFGKNYFFVVCVIILMFGFVFGKFYFCMYYHIILSLIDKFKMDGLNVDYVLAYLLGLSGFFVVFFYITISKLLDFFYKIIILDLKLKRANEYISDSKSK